MLITVITKIIFLLQEDIEFFCSTKNFIIFTRDKDFD